MTLTRGQVEEWRNKIKRKIFSDFCGEPNEDHGKMLQAQFDALCDLALSAIEQNSAASGETTNRKPVANGEGPAPADLVARLHDDEWHEMSLDEQDARRRSAADLIERLVRERDERQSYLEAEHDAHMACHRKLEAAEARIAELERDAGRRMLYSDDSYCPKCGHNRDKSSVSTIDNEDGTRTCQMCEATWRERDDIDSAMSDSAREGKG